MGSEDSRSWPKWAQCMVCHPNSGEVDPFAHYGDKEFVILSCLHAVCAESCSGQLAATCPNLDDKGNIMCPICRRAIDNITPQYVEENKIRPIEFVLGVNNDDDKTANLKPICTICIRKDIAETFCENCDKYLCKMCTDHHPYAVATADHILLKVEDQANKSLEGVEESKKKLFCKIHQKTQVNAYCDDCDEFYCNECEQRQHANHKFLTISEAIPALATKLANFSRDVGKSIKMSNSRKLEVKQKLEHLITSERDYLFQEAKIQLSTILSKLMARETHLTKEIILRTDQARRSLKLKEQIYLAKLKSIFQYAQFLKTTRNFADEAIGPIACGNIAQFVKAYELAMRHHTRQMGVLSEFDDTFFQSGFHFHMEKANAELENSIERFGKISYSFSPNSKPHIRYYNMHSVQQVPAIQQQQQQQQTIRNDTATVVPPAQQAQNKNSNNNKNSPSSTINSTQTFRPIGTTTSRAIPMQIRPRGMVQPGINQQRPILSPRGPPPGLAPFQVPSRQQFPRMRIVDNSKPYVPPSTLGYSVIKTYQKSQRRQSGENEPETVPIIVSAESLAQPVASPIKSTPPKNSPNLSLRQQQLKIQGSQLTMVHAAKERTRAYAVKSTSGVARKNTSKDPLSFNSTDLNSSAVSIERVFVTEEEEEEQQIHASRKSTQIVEESMEEDEPESILLDIGSEEGLKKLKEFSKANGVHHLNNKQVTSVSVPLNAIINKVVEKSHPLSASQSSPKSSSEDQESTASTKSNAEKQSLVQEIEDTNDTNTNIGDESITNNNNAANSSSSNNLDGIVTNNAGKEDSELVQTLSAMAQEFLEDKQKKTRISLVEQSKITESEEDSNIEETTEPMDTIQEDKAGAAVTLGRKSSRKSQLSVIQREDEGIVFCDLNSPPSPSPKTYGNNKSKTSKSSTQNKKRPPVLVPQVCLTQLDLIGGTPKASSIKKKRRKINNDKEDSTVESDNSELDKTQMEEKYSREPGKREIKRKTLDPGFVTITEPVPLTKKKASEQRKSDREKKALDTSLNNSQGGNATPGTKKRGRGRKRKILDPLKTSEESDHEDYCGICRDGGDDLLCCDYCPKIFHPSCHIPTLSAVPDGEFFCNFCRTKEDACDPNTQTEKLVREEEAGGIHANEGEFLKACKFLSEVFRWENEIEFRYSVDGVSAESFSHSPLFAIREKLASNKPAPYTDAKELIAELIEMFQQYKEEIQPRKNHFELLRLKQFKTKFFDLLDDYYPEYRNGPNEK